MSIPYFFSPLIVKDLPAGDEAKARWDRLARYQGEIPPAAYFVDGGIMSNFPIDLFHKFNTVPRMPTFGVRLGVDRNEYNKITSPLNLFGAMFNSIRHLHDYDFILRNPDYKHLIQHMNDCGLYILPGIIKDQLVSSSRAVPVRYMDTPVRMATVEFTIWRYHLRFKPETKLHAIGINSF